MTEAPRSRAREIARHPGLVAAALALWALPERWRWVTVEHPPARYVLGDMEIYLQRGLGLFDKPVTPDATFTPVGYPLFVKLVAATAGSAAIGPAQAIASALTVGLASLYARTLTRSVLAQIACGLCLAHYFPLVLYTGFYLSETWFALLVTAFVLATERACRAGPRAPSGRARGVWAAAGGALLAAATATRPSLLALAPLLALIAARSPDAGARRGMRVVLATGAALLAPLALVNSLALGRPALVATNGGVNFYLAHSDCSAVETGQGEVRSVTSHFNRTHGTEPCRVPFAAYDEGAFYRAGLAEIAAHPSRLARAWIGVSEGLGLAPRRAWPDHPFWPGSMLDEEKLNDFSQAFAPLVLLPALVHGVLCARAARGRLLASASGPRGLGWLLLGSVLFVLYAYNGNPRVRVSSDPIAVALATAAVAALVQRVSRRAARAGS